MLERIHGRILGRILDRILDRLAPPRLSTPTASPRSKRTPPPIYILPSFYLPLFGALRTRAASSLPAPVIVIDISLRQTPLHFIRIFVTRQLESLTLSLSLSLGLGDCVCVRVPERQRGRTTDKAVPFYGFLRHFSCIPVGRGCGTRIKKKRRTRGQTKKPNHHGDWG
jgi:hypothetical protein